MTRLRLSPYMTADAPAAGSVPVTVIIMTRNEQPNIARCIASVAWAEQVVVLDSGSTDDTAALARSLGPEVVEQAWLGFAAQREFALRQPWVRHDWVYFVDADEWVSAPLAQEIAQVLREPSCAGYAHRLRLVFQGRWIRHCGWYRGSWVVRLADRRKVSFQGELVGERARVDGKVGRLRNDIVDEDRKGLAAWLHKHVDYACLEAQQRGQAQSIGDRLTLLRSRTDSRSRIRAVLKDVVFPSVPAKPAALFGYMYFIRLGFLDGLAGLRFCFYHAWYEVCVAALRNGSSADALTVCPRLGIVDLHPIQYHSPLYRLLAERGAVDLDVLFLRDHGYRSFVDPGFGVPVAWNVDLLSGYPAKFLSRSSSALSRGRELASWLKEHDVVVIHGHSDPWMLLAAAICWRRGIPYLLRGDAQPAGQSTGVRALIRSFIAYVMVSRSAGGLAVGKLNKSFYERYHAPAVIFAPHSVDNKSFGCGPRESRTDLLDRLGLGSSRPVIMFCGKLQAHKRPTDIIAAVQQISCDVTLLFVGDGPLADEVRGQMSPGRGTVTGFVNQAELPAFYHAADILVLPSQAEPWGLVVNEAMAAGVFPIVSDQVGAAPDLVAGVGEIYPCGDVTELAGALECALARIKDADTDKQIRHRIDAYSVEQTAAGFEQAARSAWQQ